MWSNTWQATSSKETPRELGAALRKPASLSQTKACSSTGSSSFYGTASQATRSGQPRREPRKTRRSWTTCARALKNSRPVAGLGPPGTGKTTVLNNCVDRVLESGGRALYALPTAQLAARVRARHPTADVDTCAAAFWLWKERADEQRSTTWWW